MQTTSETLHEYKIQATRLLKQLRQATPEKALMAALRFRKLRTFSHLPLQDLLRLRTQVQHKHALAVIAMEHHYPSWAAMKLALEKRKSRSTATADTNKADTSLDKLFHPKRCCGYLNHWYADYPSAKTHQQTTGGYLFPYRNHFFIATESYLEALGLSADDQDVLTLAGDFAKPSDNDAFQSILTKLKRLAKTAA